MEDRRLVQDTAIREAEVQGLISRVGHEWGMIWLVTLLVASFPVYLLVVFWSGVSPGGQW